MIGLSNKSDIKRQIINSNEDITEYKVVEKTYKRERVTREIERLQALLPAEQSDEALLNWAKQRNEHHIRRTKVLKRLSELEIILQEE